MEAKIKLLEKRDNRGKGLVEENNPEDEEEGESEHPPKASHE